MQVHMQKLMPVLMLKHQLENMEYQHQAVQWLEQVLVLKLVEVLVLIHQLVMQKQAGM